MEIEFDFGVVSWTAKEIRDNPFLGQVLNRLSKAEYATNELLKMAIYERNTASADLFLSTLTSLIDVDASGIDISFELLKIPVVIVSNTPYFQEIVDSLLDNNVMSQAKQLIEIILSSDENLKLSNKRICSVATFLGDDKVERAHKLYSLLNKKAQSKKNKTNSLEVNLPTYLTPIKDDLKVVINELQIYDPTALGEVLALNIMNLEHRNFIKKQEVKLPPLETNFELSKYDYLRYRFDVNHPSVSDTEILLNQSVMNGLNLLEHQLRKKPVCGKHFKQFSIVTGLTTLAGQSLFGVSSAVLTNMKNDRNKDELIPKSSAVLLRCFIKWPFLLNFVDIKNVNVHAIVEHLGKKDKVGPLVCQTRLAGTRWSGKNDYGSDPSKKNDVPTQRAKSLLAALQVIIMTGNLTEYIDTILRVEYRLRGDKLDI
ncbi:hypothetical protein PULV_a4267 [Pseudoalteromonas ulvae UL12]|uniref:hypothetical protein n=1 Tax=Pseudoalteromonas ulvae TaxID=107327 RepID=UPI00186BB14A|nr:hypothetical protein [Pseudoalteromonas ulvae]MBE0361861.1 hypothetical protein [Pseudoalteromonas ulvae UL12]